MVDVGLEGTGCAVELAIVRETEKAYRLRNWLDDEFWMPKSAFDEDGELKPSYRAMYEDKLNGDA